jgi:beta-galactosidase
VVLWSLGNELQMREDLPDILPATGGVTYLRIMDVVANGSIRPSKTTVAMFPARAGGIGKTIPILSRKLFRPNSLRLTMCRAQLPLDELSELTSSTLPI